MEATVGGGLWPMAASAGGIFTVARRWGSCLVSMQVHRDGSSGTCDPAAHGGGAQRTGNSDGEHEEGNVKGNSSG
jgi:hypothetical protein